MLDQTLFVILLFILLMLLPFGASILEVILKKDAKPIHIDLERTKEPDYFGKSFMRILKTALESLKIDHERTSSYFYAKVPLPKGEEWVGFLTPDLLLEEEVPTVSVFLSDTHLHVKRTFKKEVVVLGRLLITEECSMRSLYTQGDCTVKAPTRIVRWLHVEGNLGIDSPADLGQSAYVKGDAVINSSVKFKRLYARKVSTLAYKQRKTGFKEEPINISGTLRVKGSLNIDGTRKSVHIDGDLFSDGKIELQGNVHVKGSVFSQSDVVLKDGVRIGEEGKVKSVVAKGRVLIKGAFEAYGYLHAEGGGVIEP